MHRYGMSGCEGDYVEELKEELKRRRKNRKREKEYNDEWIIVKNEKFKDTLMEEEEE